MNASNATAASNTAEAQFLAPETHHRAAEGEHSDIERATYSPDDNKLRLYPRRRLTPADYARVKAAGFIWAPKQELFVAPAWTPDREDLARELAGDVEDEDTSLVDRAEERADRFSDYQGKRAHEADQARAAVSRIADGIPFGQPILVGHHSERHARRDAERITAGMRRAVSLWETSAYWKSRAAGALAHAKYKELPAVRARRIKGIEADLRKSQKVTEEASAIARVWAKVPRFEWDRQTAVALAIAGRVTGGDYGVYSELHAGRMHGDTAWRRVVAGCEARIAWHARWIAHYENRLAYERAMLAEAGGLVADRYDLQPGGVITHRGRKSVILRVNRKDDRIISVSVTGQGWTVGVEEITAYEPPSQTATEAVAAVLKKPPLCNYPGEGFVHITQVQWDACGSDYKSTTRQPKVEGLQPHRARVMLGVFAGVQGDANARHGYPFVYITDAKRTDPLKVGEEPKPKRKSTARKIAEAAGVDTSSTPDPAPLPRHVVGGLSFAIVAEYADTEEGTNAANAYIEAHPGAAVLAVTEGRILLADRDDTGQVINPRMVLADLAAPNIAQVQAQLDTMAARRAAREQEQAEAAPYLAARAALREGSLVQTAVAPQLFPTPAAAATRMVDLAEIRPDSRILEPQAGTGAILRALRAAGVLGASIVRAVEINHDLARLCAEQFPEVIVTAADFLSLDPATFAGRFDVILSNPPFANAVDIEHIQHARRFLAPGGRLVAICAGGPRQAAALQPLAAFWEPLPEGTFAAQGTGVRTVLLKITNP